MQDEIEIYEDANEPLQRAGRGDEHEEDAEQELLRATQFEFREPASLQAEPHS